MADETAVTVALIGLAGVGLAALSGIAGAILGSAIAARAARQSAKATQAETQASRLEARHRQFADRMLELTATLYERAIDIGIQVTQQVQFRIRHPADRPPEVTFDVTAFVLAARELRLLVRSPSAVAAIDVFASAVGDVANFALHNKEGGPIEDAEVARFWLARESHASALQAFDVAMRRELGTQEDEPGGT